MKYIRFFYEGAARFGLLQEDKILELNGNFLDGGQPTGQTFSIDSVRLLSPVTGGQIFAVGLNYREHAAELNESVLSKFPAFFVKLPHTVIGQNDAIIPPPESNRVDYEAELAVVLGKDCYHADIEQAREAIFGFTCLNDVTARDLQKVDGQWMRCKNFRTFCPIGPCVDTNTDGRGLDITAVLNGKIVQHSNTSDMIFPPAELVRLISQVVPLRKGDILSTGTPAGIGPMVPGDIIEVSVEGIGTLRNIVRIQEEGYDA